MSGTGIAATKKSWEQEIKEHTKIEGSPDDFLRFYFTREEEVLQKIFGIDWKRHIRHTKWPREKYVIRHVQGSISSMCDEEEQKKHREAAIKITRMKAKGLSFFAKPNK